jgi:hypothetical protein
MTARIFNALAGVWLFISAFTWPRYLGERINAVTCGVLCVLFALLALYSEPARYLNVALGAWVFLSAFLLPSLSHQTLWNDAVIGIGIFASGLLGAGPEQLRNERQLYGRSTWR